jgi:hypothetical protein
MYLSVGYNTVLFIPTQVKLVIELTAHFEHVQIIRCDFESELVGSFIDLQIPLKRIICIINAVVIKLILYPVYTILHSDNVIISIT